MGSSKTATAVVPVPFMQNITQLNKAMIERIVILTSKKKNQDRGLGVISNHNKKRNTGFLYEVLIKELTKMVVHNNLEKKQIFRD